MSTQNIFFKTDYFDVKIISATKTNIKKEFSMNFDTNQKINFLRELMKKNKITAYLVTSSDFHESEYPEEFFKTRKFISGFSGSSGTAFITLKNSYLWTDGRYFLQAEKEIFGSEIKLFKSGIKGTPTIKNFIKSTLKKGDCLAFDGRTTTYKFFKDLEEISKLNKFNLNTNFDLINDIWKDRPKLSKKEIFILEKKYSGKSTEKKLEELRDLMRNKNVNCHILSSLDDISWLFNLRGNDIKYTPVILAYSIIYLDKAILFVDESKISSVVNAYLQNNHIEVRNYDEFYNHLNGLKKTSKILLDFEKINASIYNNINEEIALINEPNPEVNMKSIKNKIEIKNNYKAHIKDGIAMTKFIFWLKNNIKKTKINELDVVKKIEYFRKLQEGFKEPSFETIAAYGKNAAMMHYLPNSKNFSELKAKNLILIDSGGQYLEGTTDITRTISLGEVDKNIKKHYTYVLKSLITLSKAIFPHRTLGGNLDAIARNIIWELGLDYRSSTGHGVGHFLNVHEGPNVFRPSANCVIHPNMVSTIEPGIYIENSHGIRIENETLTSKIFENEYGEFLEFKTITFVPIDLDAIDFSCLSNSEKKWLNCYHELVFKKISPYLNENEKEWLKNQTRKI